MTRTIPSSAVASEQALLMELRRNLTVASNQNGQDIQAVYLAEAETRGEGWSGRLRAALGLPVEPFDPLGGVAAAASIPPELHGRFLGPIGLLAARAEPALPINFVQPRQPRRTATQETPAKKKALIAVLAAVLLFGILGIGGYLLLLQLESKNRNLRSELETTKERIKAAEIDAKRLAAVQEYEARSVNWLDEYYEQAARFPDLKKLRLTHFHGVTLPLPSDKDRAAEAKAAAVKNAPARKAGTLTLTLTGDKEHSGLADSLTSAIQKDLANYHSAVLKISAGSGGAAKTAAQTYTIEIGVGHRKPEDYKRLAVPAEPIIIMTGKPPEEKKDEKTEEKKDVPDTSEEDAK
jgi:hypothetical protein